MILYYTTSTTQYYGSIVVSRLINNWYQVFIECNKIGYFMVYWETGLIQNSPSSNDMIKLVGYDIIK